MDFFGIGGWEFLVLILLAMFIFGPDKLPKAISDGVRMLRNLRDMARNATTDLSRELGTEISLEDLNPKSLIRKHILSEEDERAIRQPLESIYQDVRKDVTGVRGDLQQVARDVDIRHKPVSAHGPTAIAPTASVPTASVPSTGAANSFDVDAT
jgi:sec-independent protein translocase protein TatB